MQAAADPVSSPGVSGRYGFRFPTPVGDVDAAYELSTDALRFRADAAIGDGPVEILWRDVREGVTASMPGPVGGGRRGAPDMPRWVPATMEWLVLSRHDGARPFSGVLPAGPDREALLAAVKARLGDRWLGEGKALAEVHQRFGMATGGESLKAAGIVAVVLAMLVAMLFVVVSVLAQPILALLVMSALGGWFFHRGLAGLRDSLAIANTPSAHVRSAAMGFVELQGRAVIADPLPAAISGRACLWWDAAVSAWSEDSEGTGRWQPLAARHGGTINTVEIADESGHLPVWLRDAELGLESRAWESDKDALPPPGLAWLDQIGVVWSGGRRLRVSETGLYADAPLYVLGTLDLRANLADGEPTALIARGLALIRSGHWRGALVGRLPRALRLPVGALFGLFDMLTKIGRGGERVPEVGPPPDLMPDAAVVWKGRQHRPLFVSGLLENNALQLLRQRSLLQLAIGGFLLLLAVADFITAT